MKQEDWTSQLRERLEGHETPVPEGLWQQIEAHLPEGRKAKVRPLKRWIAVAAAALLVGGMGLGLLWKSNSQHDVTADGGANIINNVREKLSSENRDDASSSNDNDVKVAQATDNGSKDVRIQVGGKYFVVSSKVVDGEPVGFSVKVEDKIDEPQTAQNTPQSQASSTENRQRSQSASAVRNSQTTTTHHPSPITHRPHFYQRFTASLAAGGLTYMGGGNQNVASPYYSQASMPFSDFQSSGANTLVSINENSFRIGEHADHKAPLTFGLKLGYSVSSRLWVESGVQYSKLSSTFVREMPNSELTSEQALHYVGVPFGVGYRIFDVGRLSFYGVAGAQADFNVSAKNSIEGVETDGKKDDVQFSANASLGAQVKITPHLGIYVEPGARYYFDNGSNVQNYFKDKKLNFNLQVGARWNVGGK